MSKFFIDRPIFSAVLSIIVVLAGLVAAKVLPIAAFPDIAPPTVLINATYNGASAETLIRTVAAPIEEQLAGVEDMVYFNTVASSTGTLQTLVTFEVGTDVDKAVFNVNNRVQLAAPRLPPDVIRNGVTVAKRSLDILLVVALRSPDSRFDALYLSNYALLNLVDDLKRVSGVSDVTIFGARDYSIRVWVDPDKMARLGVTTTDVSNAISAQNQQYAAGKIGGEPAPAGQAITYTVNARGRMTDPAQFGDIVVRANGPGGTLRLRDIARIELGALNYDVSYTLDGKEAIGMAVFLQAGGNALSVADAVRTRMDELRARFPEGVEYLVPFDPTRYIRASIHEVVVTIFIAALLVMAVVFLFLQNWRATLIPMVAVPVSLIGTFAGLWLFHFTINTLTLFGMVLAIGIVVDDAIVVLENCERLMREHGMTARAAATEAMREVQFAIIAIVLVLTAVFVPVAFLGGIAGQLYRQFAVTVAISVVISGFVALTLSPALCALMLQPGDHESRLFRPFNRAFAATTRTYLGAVDLALSRRLVSALLLVIMVVAVGWMFTRVPRSFVPNEDQGYIISALVLPDAATLGRTKAAGALLQQAVGNDPAVEHMFVVSGFDLIGGGNKTNVATSFLPLRPWDERTTTASQVVQKVNRAGMTLPDGLAFAFNPPAIRGLGTASGFEVYVRARTDPRPARLLAVVNDFNATLARDPRLTGINTFYRATVPQLFVDVDREKATSLGVPVADVYSALGSTIGSFYVNDFDRFGHTYRVELQSDAPFRSRPDDLGRVYVRSATTGEMIPLKAVIETRDVVGPEQLERFNGFLAAKVLGAGKPGVSSGDAIAAVREIAATALPEGYDIAWTGQAFQELRTGSASAFAFGFALVMVFLILAALYERWGLPLAVLLAVPFAIAGALIFVTLRGMEDDIYFQIGLVVLIGLAAKNAILIVEFAHQAVVLEGKTAIEGALQAARLRFRPIVMTSLAFVFGVLPLAFATGAGASARRSMGTGVAGGMIAATFIATIFVPLFFVWLSRRAPDYEVAAREAAREAARGPAAREGAP
jgi:multidrug efflux pump